MHIAGTGKGQVKPGTVRAKLLAGLVHTGATLCEPEEELDSFVPITPRLAMGRNAVWNLFRNIFVLNLENADLACRFKMDKPAQPI